MTDTDVAIAAADAAPVTDEPAAPADPSGDEGNKDLSALIDDAFKAVDEKAQQAGEEAAEEQSEDGKSDEIGNKPANDQAKADPKDDQSKPEDKGHFADAPERFSADAKAVWKDAPEPVRAEISRAITELENGIEKYRSDSESFEPFREYAEELKQTGQSFQEVRDHYTNIENMLARNPVAGLDTICQNVLKMDLKTLAGRIVGQASGENNDQGNDQIDPRDAIINELRHKITELTGSVSQISQTNAQQQQNAVMSEISAFAADHPRVEELSEDICLLLDTGKAANLQQAYDIAVRINPVAEKKPAEPAQKEPEKAAKAQTQKGQLSVTGAPGSGSDPLSKRPPSSASQAVDDAFEAAGL